MAKVASTAVGPVVILAVDQYEKRPLLWDGRPDRAPAAAVTGLVRPTERAVLDLGPVEYRFDRRGPRTVVVFHGGHMHAGLALGEDRLAEAGYSVLVPSRPGYGRTPLATGRTPDGFADVTRSLCERLGVGRVAAVVGVSAGGPTATAAALRHPGLVDRLVLQCSTGPLPWPDRRTRTAARLVFAPPRERLTWALVRAVLRTAPDTGLRLLLGDLTTGPARDVLSSLDRGTRSALLDLFAAMRSGSGFVNDLSAGHGTLHRLAQPALVVATRQDGAVPFRHAEALAAALPDSTLLECASPTHLLWFGPGWDAAGRAVVDFLAR